MICMQRDTESWNSRCLGGTQSCKALELSGQHASALHLVSSPGSFYHARVQRGSRWRKACSFNALAVSGLVVRPPPFGRMRGPQRKWFLPFARVGRASQDGFTSLQMTSLRTLFRTPYISPEKSARTSRKIGRDIPPFSLFFRHTCSRYLLLSGVNTGPLGRVHDGWQARRAYVLCLKGEVTMAPRRTTTSRPDVPPALDQLLTIKQAAARLGISDSKFYRLMRDRRVGIPVIRMPGHTTRIPAAKLQLWIERHTDQAM